ATSRPTLVNSDGFAQPACLNRSQPPLYQLEAIMSWKEAFATHVGPGALCGLTLRDWLRLLWDSRFSVDLAYWPRAAMVTAGSLQNSAFALWEKWRYDAEIRATE